MWMCLYVKYNKIKERRIKKKNEYSPEQNTRVSFSFGQAICHIELKTKFAFQWVKRKCVWIICLCCMQFIQFTTRKRKKNDNNNRKTTSKHSQIGNENHSKYCKFLPIPWKTNYTHECTVHLKTIKYMKDEKTVLTVLNLMQFTSIFILMYCTMYTQLPPHHALEWFNCLLVFWRIKSSI